MKKKAAIFFVLLFVCTMAFSFGFSTSASAGSSDCCWIPATPQCQGHWGRWNDDLGLCFEDHTVACFVPYQCY